MPIDFHPLGLHDREAIMSAVRNTENRNCDLNFVNLIGWRFLYDTELAAYEDKLIVRFKANGHLAYQAPIGAGDWTSALCAMLHDAELQGHPFLMLGVCENAIAKLEDAMPGHFFASADRNFTDYIYDRAKLETLAGKKLQSKRNFANRFEAANPDWQAAPLMPADIPQCIELEAKWKTRKTNESVTEAQGYQNERRSILTVFRHWDELPVSGCVLRAGGKIVAFSYGGPVNADTFDVCVEKADTAYEGAYAVINREFVRMLPPQYVYINREEDLGISGLRKAKLSYHPSLLLNKYTVMAKHPLGN